MKSNSSETEFLILEVKKTFIYLQKVFTKELILEYFDPESHLWIETNTLRYTISRVLSQMTLNQLSSNLVIHKNYSDFLKSEISQ